MKKVFLVIYSVLALNVLAEPLTQDVKVMVPIVEKTAEGEFRDCLYFTMDQWLKLNDSDIVDQKNQRKTSWLSFITQAKQPQPVVEPTLEDVETKVKQAEDTIKQQQSELETLKSILIEVVAIRDLRGDDIPIKELENEK